MEEVEEEESIAERYSKMSKIEKLALLMIALGPEAASTLLKSCLLYTSPSPRDYAASRMPSSA